MQWEGLVIATERDAPVKAVAAGRVVYADWLPGLGLLAIVDHGEGYLSLYGHNDRLLKAAGEPVAAGEPIAAAGDTGGRALAGAVFRDPPRRQTSGPAPLVQDRSPRPLSGSGAAPAPLFGALRWLQGCRSRPGCGPPLRSASQ